LPASSFNGETLYIRLKEHNQYTLFSPFYTPTLTDYDHYECQVGMGYNKYTSIMHGIKTEITVFVPLNDHRVIRDIKITNLRKTSVECDVIPLVEYTHFEALKQFNNADWVPQTMMSELYQNNDYTTLFQYAFMKKDTSKNFFTSNHIVSSFETDKQTFLGDNGYGTFLDPLSLHHQELSNSIALRGDNIAALMHHLDPLSPNESIRIITQLGQTSNLNEEHALIQSYRDPNYVDQAFKTLNQYWNNTLSKCVIKTPNQAMNSMLNIFNPRQCLTTLNWSRYLSLYQLGLGARGIGFRDSSQDIIGALIQNPVQSKKRLKMLLNIQKRDGSAMHQFNPITMIANEGDSLEEEDRDHFYGDDHLWIVLAVSEYLKETGDLSFLNDVIPFYDKDKNDHPLEKGTVLEHIKRALTFTQKHTGKHGLPLLGFADWNDTVNLPKGSESIFNANLYGVALKEMIELYTYLDDKAQIKAYQKDYKHMKKCVNTHAWDGQWYIRYIDHLGKPYGSHTNTHGQIYTNAQSWTVLSGFATKTRAKKALESLRKHLNTEKGIKLSTPGYNSYDKEKGGVTTYPPGAKENGGIFLHSNPWVMIAETILGHGNRAFEYYNQINPATKNNSIEEFECEPYVYPQNILGDEHPQFGLGRNSWLSGTASWTYQAGIKYILGILPTYQGLKIDPCIPSDWDTFTVTRQFRGATYHITINNPNHNQKGVQSIKLNGQPIKGTILPILEKDTQSIIEVTMK
jgi:cellobiose phosphorylase